MEQDSSDLDLWTCQDVCNALRIGRSTLNAYRRTGRFPKPLRMPPDGKRPTLRWTRAAIADWLAGEKQ